MLLNLPDDTLLTYIIPNIDFCSLLRFVETSKRLYDLCDKREIWDRSYQKVYFRKCYENEYNKMIRYLIQRTYLTTIPQQFQVNDKFSRCILNIHNKHSSVFDIFEYCSKENKILSTSIIQPNERKEIQTFLYTKWFVLPKKEWYNEKGYLNQGFSFLITIHNILLIDRTRFGNDWSHRLYDLTLSTRPHDRRMYFGEKSIYAKRKLKF